MQHNGWDHGLKVTDDGAGLVGHGGGVPLRKLADQCGLTAALEEPLARAGTFPQLSRSVVFVSMAVAIALGGTSMSDVAVLALADNSDNPSGVGRFGGQAGTQLPTLRLLSTQDPQKQEHLPTSSPPTLARIHINLTGHRCTRGSTSSGRLRSAASSRSRKSKADAYFRPSAVAVPFI